MTEEELIEEGFERIDVPMEESGDEEDYYYYRYAFGRGFSMISTENTESSKKNKWSVTFEEFVDNIVDIEDVQTLMALFKKCNKKR
jgi:hypothetical protein